MDKVTNLQTLSAIGRKFALSFDKKYKYYNGNAYVNSNGDQLPNYMPYKGRVFCLWYVSGCFSPYLYDCTKEVKQKINTAFDRLCTLDETSQAYKTCKEYIEELQNLFF
jgi:hypothetical protein